MSAKFKLVLLTSLVTALDSFAAGDDYEAGNDEAWQMIHDGIAELKNPKGKNKQEPPQKPARIAKAEAEAAAKAEQQLELVPVHAEGKELNAALEKLASLRAANTKQGEQVTQMGNTVAQQAEYIATLEAEVEKLEGEVTTLEEEKVALQEELAELKAAAEQAAEPTAQEADGKAETDNAGGEQQ
ncbi:hypothetical protein JF535_13225 [Microbulbifer salipaludis]|uniref:TolA protein n=1 Tax=Microbulbifer salipaludis TaxID=187980 RepID=A0ABS3E919_9GAMM|nr:hypothetical protein [Microbulbifer salipaludis]MBN8431813.1 hypothetical protein [Microbulbifer salipaludis]